MDKITLVVADDHPLFRRGVVDTLSLEGDFHVIAQATDGDEALEKIVALKPTVAILDVNMPGLNGQRLTHRLKSENSSTRVILLTGYDSVEQAIHAMIAGASGYCVKDTTPIELTRIVRMVADGKYVVEGNVFNRRELNDWIEDRIEGARRIYREPGASFHPLSDREMEVLVYVVRGMSNKEIASQLGISHQTIKNHVTAILQKFGVEDRTQAAVYALKRGWINFQSGEK